MEMPEAWFIPDKVFEKILTPTEARMVARNVNEWLKNEWRDMLQTETDQVYSDTFGPGTKWSMTRDENSKYCATIYRVERIPQEVEVGEILEVLECYGTGREHPIKPNELAKRIRKYGVKKNEI